MACIDIECSGARKSLPQPRTARRVVNISQTKCANGVVVYHVQARAAPRPVQRVELTQRPGGVGNGVEKGATSQSEENVAQRFIGESRK